MEILNTICTVLLKLLTVLTFYKIIYTIVGFFAKAKSLPPAKPDNAPIEKHKFGVVICARNERTVIGNLIDSIHKQTYDQDKITIFVCADNCTDDTAQICQDMGCVVYERHCPEKARKGYALEFLYQKIQEDYGIESFDGFFTFDADNLLKEDFIETMNKVFKKDSGVIVSYRNTKNFDTNAISAAYGIHFYEATMKFHRPRGLFGVNTHIAGTGFLTNSRLLKDGWHYLCLAEDAEFTMKVTSLGEKIEFCEQAEFYDEQPHNFSVAWRQRIRWARGRLVAFLLYAHHVIAKLFTVKTLRRKFSCYDIFFYEFPFAIVSGILSALYPCINIIIAIVNGSFWATLNVPHLLWLALSAFALFYIKDVLIGALVCIRERKHIHCSTGKLIFYVLTWFWFSLISMPVAIISLFLPVKWKPIKHDDTTKIEDLSEKK